MYWYYYRSKYPKRYPGLLIAYEVLRNLFSINVGHKFSLNKDDKSKKNIMERQLRCAASGCFDKADICCKECDIKTCRYKCNFMDKEACEHQFYE